MIVVTGWFRFPQGSIEAARPAMARVIAASRSESGCLGYDYAEDVLEPGLFRVTEAWTDRDALSRHFKCEHMALWREERARLGLFDRSVTAHVVTASEPL